MSANDHIHSRASAHYEGMAVDLHSSAPDALAEAMRQAGFLVLWRVPGHFGHLHVEVRGGCGPALAAPPGAGRAAAAGCRLNRAAAGSRGRSPPAAARSSATSTRRRILPDGDFGICVGERNVANPLVVRHLGDERNDLVRRQRPARDDDGLRYLAIFVIGHAGSRRRRRFAGA